jgi:uncharacterized membrane protein HdeD (DUF308 family)
MRTKTLHWSYTGWTVILFYAVCGLLLLLWPDLALKTANFALAGVLCIMGVIAIVDYLRGETMAGILGYGLAKGLILLMVGVWLMIRSDFLINLLPFLWGLAMIAGGFAKVQVAFDLKRVDRNRWWLMLLGALLSFTLGIIAVTRSEFLAYTVTQIAGISLLVEAALDVIALTTVRRELKRMQI